MLAVRQQVEHPAAGLILAKAAVGDRPASTNPSRRWENGPGRRDGSSAARASCLRLFLHWVRRAASRADCTAGSKMATSIEMIAITINSSTSVNAGAQLAQPAANCDRRSGAAEPTIRWRAVMAPRDKASRRPTVANDAVHTTIGWQRGQRRRRSPASGAASAAVRISGLGQPTGRA